MRSWACVEINQISSLSSPPLPHLLPRLLKEEGGGDSVGLCRNQPIIQSLLPLPLERRRRRRRIRPPSFVSLCLCTYSIFEYKINYSPLPGARPAAPGAPQRTLFTGPAGKEPDSGSSAERPRCWLSDVWGLICQPLRQSGRPECSGWMLTQHPEVSTISGYVLLVQWPHSHEAGRIFMRKETGAPFC